MNVFRTLLGIAGIATLIQFLVVTLGSASLLTLDGNTLRIVAAILGLVLALLLPAALGWSAARAVGQKREVKKSRIVLGVMALLNGLAAGSTLYAMNDAQASLTQGAQALMADAAAPAATTPESPEGTPAPASEPALKGTVSVEASRDAVRAVLHGRDPVKSAEALSSESAAAVGAMWMAFLSETYGDELRRKAGDAAWASVHEGLPERADLWRDPASLENELIADGRGFLTKVALLADAAADGEGTGSLIAPVLPEKLLQRWLLEGDALASEARYREVAMNRIEVELPGTVVDVRYEDRGWRVHLGDYGDLANRRVSPRAMMLTLHP